MFVQFNILEILTFCILKHPTDRSTIHEPKNSPKCLAQIISRMLNCTNILDNVPSSSGPDRAQRQQSNLIIPPNVWQTNQDRIKNVELYTHFRNCVLPSQGPTGPKDNNQT